MRLGQGDLPLDLAREVMGPDKLIGISTPIPTWREVAAGRHRRSRLTATHAHSSLFPISPVLDSHQSRSPRSSPGCRAAFLLRARSTVSVARENPGRPTGSTHQLNRPHSGETPRSSLHSKLAELCISVVFFVAPHIRRCASSRKSTQTCDETTNGGKRKD